MFAIVQGSEKLLKDLQNSGFVKKMTTDTERNTKFYHSSKNSTGV
jgi:hypothetical protein